MTYKSLRDIGLLSFVCALIIGFASTTHESLPIIAAARMVLLSVAALSVAVLLLRQKIQRELLFSIAIAWTVYLFAIFRGVAAFDTVSAEALLLTSIVIVSIGQIFLSFPIEKSTQDFLGRNLIRFSILMFIFTIAVGGFALLPSPRFLFDFETASGSQIEYSQGVASFFGFAAIAAAYCFRSAETRAARATFISLVFLLLFLSVAGGSRGEPLFAAVVVVGVLAGSRNGLLMVSALALLTVATVIAGSRFFEGLVAVQRFQEVFGGYFGQRDILLQMSFDLLAQEPGCFIWGCGYFYFQQFHGADYGLYPHNIYIEAIISFGFPITTLLFILAIIGVFSGRKLGLLSGIGSYTLLIGIKSGDIVGSWIALIFIFHLCGMGLSALTRSYRVTLKKRTI